MHNMTKGGPAAAVTGDKARIEVAWKNTTGGAKGISGALKATKGTDLDMITVGLLGTAAKGICWHADTDPFNNGSLIAGKDATGRRLPFGKKDPLSREAHDVDFSRIPPYVDTLVFFVSAYKPGVSFSDVSSVTVQVTVDNAPWEPCRITVNASQNTCATLRARRAGTGWELSLVDELVQASTQDQLMSTAALYA